jgi:hypothetical protein
MQGLEVGPGVLDMAKIIEFYVPINFRVRKNAKKIDNQKGGQVIEFVPCPKRSA